MKKCCLNICLQRNTVKCVSKSVNMNLLRCFRLGSSLFSTPEWEKKNRGSICSVEDSLLFQATIWCFSSNALVSAGLCWYISDPTLSSHIKTKCIKMSWTTPVAIFKTHLALKKKNGYGSHLLNFGLWHIIGKYISFQCLE